MSWLNEDIPDPVESGSEAHAPVDQLRTQLAEAPRAPRKSGQQGPKTSLAVLLLLAVMGWAVVHFSVKGLRAQHAMVAQAPAEATSTLSAPVNRTEPVASQADALPAPRDLAVNRTRVGEAQPLRPETPKATRTDATRDATAATKPPKPATQTAAAAAPAPGVVVAPDQPGDKELRTGRQYLAGDGVPRNSAEAARWLWRAVAARNTAAEMELASLYAKGEGVAKNCEQAKILLDSAARRGVEAAGAQLKQLNETGCQ